MDVWSRLSRGVRRRLLGIASTETSTTRRGFYTGRARVHLELIGENFLHGYHAALDESDYDMLVRRLESIPAEWQGFAFEGAAMALTLLDLLTPWRRDRLARFIGGPGRFHIYMVHVGAGWALARLSPRPLRALARLDPLLGWLAIDGYGFHAGYFAWRRFVRAQALPRRLDGYALRVFDQGLGRSLWFVEGADVERIASTMMAFPPARRSDLWSGVGLACTYAGGVERHEIVALQEAARPYAAELAQGAAFAAEARRRAMNSTPHTDLACSILCGCSTVEAAQWTEEARRNLPFYTDTPAYELWRQRIREMVAQEVLR